MDRRRTVKLGDVLERVRRPVAVEPKRTYKEIGIRSHGRGVFHKQPVSGADLGNKSVFWVEPDCLVLNIVFAWERAVAKTTQSEAGMIASHRFPMYRVRDKQVDLDYLVYFLLSARGEHMLRLASPGGAGRNKTLGQAEFLSLRVPLPPPAEQKKVVEILRASDDAIATLERLIAAKHSRNRGLMQALLADPKRVCSWRSFRLNELFERVVRKNAEGNRNVLTISGQHGLVSQLDYFNKSVAGRNLHQYTLLKRGEFAYNRSRSSGYPFGAIKRLSVYSKGVVSTLYMCFRVKRSDMCVDFLEHYFESGALNRQIYSIAEEGARSHGLLNVSVKDFFSLSLPIPTEPEQRQIADILNTATEETRILEELLEAHRLRNRGLMQQLLSGQARVKAEGAEVVPA